MSEKNKVFVHIDKVKSNAHIETIVSKEVLKAGQFVELGKVSEEYDGEVVEHEKAKAKGEAFGVVVPVHLDYGTMDFDEANMVVEAGKPARVYIIERGNMLSFHKDMVGELKAGEKAAIGEDGFGLQTTEGEDAVALAIDERYIPNIGDVVTVRFI